MDTRAYNDYVLTASRQAGWITSEQEQVARSALNGLPEAAALDFLLEQQLISEANGQTLKDLIRGVEEKHGSGASANGTSSSSTSSSVSVGGNAKSLKEYLSHALQVDASDLHLGPYSPPLLRINGHLQPIEEGAASLNPGESEALARQFLTPEQVKEVEEHGSIEFCYDAGELGRYRSSVVRQRRGWESVFRVISNRIRSMDDLGLPKVLYELTRYHNGLILVTGPVGCGKTTTLASMVNHINHERKDHIITLEDPIEYVFHSASCQVTQRGVGVHSESFASALRASLRQDPDVIMVGEMRDLETISLAITASETGHLVLATLHTSTAARTMQRLLDVFPVNQQAQIRTMVSESLRGVICQQLIPRVDGKGRALALEVLTNSPAVAALIRDGKNYMLPGIMQTGRKLGMRLMDDSLIELVEQKLISPDEAMQRAENTKNMAQLLAGKM